MATTTTAAAKAPARPQDLYKTLAACATDRKPLPLGVYFGLDQELYHADPGLGSGDIRRALKGAMAFWYESKLNPNRGPDNSTPAKVEGSAVHRIVLEGLKPFQADYVRRPDDPDGATSSEKGAITKAAKAKLLAGQELLHGDAYDRTLLVAGEIAANPELASAFQNGMPEVAIFWEEPGADGGEPVRCKALIDYLKIRGNGDLKTIANALDLEFQLACRRAIRYQRMPIQGALYWRGRRELAAFFKAGQVFGAVDMEWLARVAATPPGDVGWQWVFYQREGAPEVWSKTMTPSPRNPIWMRAQHDVDEALLRYQRWLATFGPDEPWHSHEPVSELTEDELAQVAGDY